MCYSGIYMLIGTFAFIATTVIAIIDWKYNTEIAKSIQKSREISKRKDKEIAKSIQKSREISKRKDKEIAKLYDIINAVEQNSSDVLDVKN